MRFKNITIGLLCLLTILLTSCFNEKPSILINNSIPRAKVVIDKDPNEEDFYNANYNTVTQSIYKKNIEIILLKQGSNQLDIDKTSESYAIYFLLPSNHEESNSESWKYLIKLDKKSSFIVDKKGNIEKR